MISLGGSSRKRQDDRSQKPFIVCSFVHIDTFQQCEASFIGEKAAAVSQTKAKHIV